jgi:hypothetical protein
MKPPSLFFHGHQLLRTNSLSALSHPPRLARRLNRKVPKAGKKKPIDLDPSFNPPRELTSYEFTYALSEVMPALYKKVRCFPARECKARLVHELLSSTYEIRD